MGAEDLVNTYGQKLMNIDLNQVQAFLSSSLNLLLIASADIVIIDTLLVLGGIKSDTLRLLVALAILYATLKKMYLAMFLFHLFGLPLLLMLAFGGIIMRIVFAPVTVAKKAIKRKKK